MSAYIEQTDDIFDGTSWLEIVAGEGSPGNTGLTNDGQEATLVGYIPWNMQRSCAQYFLGFAYSDTASPWLLHRINPQPHPVFPWLYASQVSFTPFNLQTNEDNADGAPNMPGPFGTSGINIATYKFAVCTIHFRSYRCVFLGDSDLGGDPRNEWMRNTIVEVEPRVEALSVDNLSQLAFVETSPAVTGPPTIPAGPVITGSLKQIFPAPLAQLLSKALYTFTWTQVPFEYLSSVDEYFYPNKILACIGKVNSQPFPINAPFDAQFPAGTLLLDAPRFTQKVFPVANAMPSSPLISVDVALPMQYFNPTSGAVPTSSFAGHNLMPWRTNGLWYYCTRGDGNNPPTINTPPLLQSADFNAMFTNGNDSTYPT